MELPVGTRPARGAVALCLGQGALLSAYLAVPTLYLASGLVIAALYALLFPARTAYLLALVQLGVTAGYASQRAVPVFIFGGMAFTPLDVFIAPALLFGVTSIPSILRIANRTTRRALGFLLALLAFIPVAVLVTWVFVPADSSIAFRNLRSYLYLLCIPAFVSESLKARSRQHWLMALNLAAAGAATALLAAAVANYSVVGFEDQSLVLANTGLSRLGILDEGLIPVLIAAAATSALIGGRELRATGLVAFPLLVAALFVSPGRGAIFTSILITSAILVSYLSGLTRPAGQRGRGATKRLIVSLLVAAVVVPTLSSALGALGRQGQDVTVVAARTADALIPWHSENALARYNGWRAGIELGSQSLLLGNGLGHTFPHLESKYRLDSPFNFPSMPVNVFAKTGLIGLFLLTGLLLYLGRASWSWWSLRTGTVELAALPMLAALLIRGISDDVFLAFQTPVILGVIAAMCAMRKPNRTMPQPSAQGTLIQPSEVK